MARITEDVKISLKTASIPVGQRAEDVKISLVTATIPVGQRAEDVTISLLTKHARPIAEFYGTPLSGVEPLTVQFYDKSYNVDPTSWSWNFGDGNTSTDQNPSHIYTDDGTFTVALTATNAYGSSTETKIDYITVTAGSPYFDITKILTGTLPDRVYILPIVNSLANITIKAGSGTDSNPAISETRLVTITGQYLRIKIYFDSTDILRKILIFKIFD